MNTIDYPRLPHRLPSFKLQFAQKKSIQRKGFTLMELIIAALILALTLGGLLGASTANFGLVESAGNLSTAISHARCVMEEIRDLNIPAIITTDEEGNDRDWTAWAQRDITDPDGGGSCNSLENETIQVSYPAGITANPLEVLVTVNWTERGRARSVQLATLVTER